MSGEEIDQSSFASILAGVQKIRDQYEPSIPSNGPKRPHSPTSRPTEARITSPKPIEPVPSSSTVKNPAENVKKSRELSLPPNLPPKSSTNSPVSGLREGLPNQKRSRSNQNVHSYSSVQVAQSQKGNPLLECPSMKMTPWTFSGQILLDYYINATNQVLFLSLKYHKLRPEYIWRRITKLKGGTSSSDIDVNDQALRVLLVVVDIDSPQDSLRSLLVICIKNDLTLVIAWSFEEAGNYIAYLKLNEMARSKVASSIQGVKKADYNSQILDTLTTVRAVNKTDVANLLANCKSFREIVLASTNEDGLKQIPGLGNRKVQNLNAVFSNPFVFNKEEQN